MRGHGSLCHPSAQLCLWRLSAFTVRHLAYGCRSLLHVPMQCTSSTVRHLAYGEGSLLRGMAMRASLHHAVHFIGHRRALHRHMKSTAIAYAPYCLFLPLCSPSENEVHFLRHPAVLLCLPHHGYFGEDELSVAGDMQSEDSLHRTKNEKSPPLLCRVKRNRGVGERSVPCGICWTRDGERWLCGRVHRGLMRFARFTRPLTESLIRGAEALERTTTTFLK